KLKEEIKKIVGKYLDLNAYQIFFFGSRVKGDNFPCSDIDIGIEGTEEIPPEAKFKIEEELENLPILYKIEVVDFKHVSEDFRREALKFVEYIR
ncbi:MAG: nucleotidyltransferase domain-containing protein, partial [Candidatus Omnitrophota bacterium]